MYRYVEPSPTNVFALKVEPSVDSFKIANTTVNAKTLTITTPYLDNEITIKLEHRAASTITFPSSITWKDANAPIFTVGKIYFLYLITDNGGVSYQGTWTGSW